MVRARNWREVRAEALAEGRITEEGVADARRAREDAMAESYDRFYGGEVAPVPDVAAALWGKTISADEIHRRDMLDPEYRRAYYLGLPRHLWELHVTIPLRIRWARLSLRLRAKLMCDRASCRACMSGDCYPCLGPPCARQLFPADDDGVEVIELTAEEGRALFDKAARRNLGISGEEFLRRLDAGEYPACGCHPIEVFKLRMLEPFGR